MRLLIASDLHGSATYTHQLAARFAHEGADKFVLLGDLLYHGPRNDLPTGYAPKEVIVVLSTLRDKILCVRGNCDAQVDQMMLPFPLLQDTLMMFVDGHTLVALHGHEALPPLVPGTIVLTGHTHIPMLAQRDGITHLNPGSVALPKEGSAHSYMTYENGCFTLKSIDGRVLSSLQI